MDRGLSFPGHFMFQLFYWDKFRDTSMGRYQFRHEYAFVIRVVRTMTLPCKFLDLGCGSGRMTRALRNADLNVVGIDSNPTALAAFRVDSCEIPLVRGDALHLPFADSSFDCITAIQSLDFMDCRLLLKECQRVLSNGGLLVFDAVNRLSYKGLLKRLVGRVYDLPSLNLSYHEVLQATVDQGFKLQVVRGYNWVPFTRESNSPMVNATAWIERSLQLNRCYRFSPKILIAARKDI